MKINANTILVKIVKEMCIFMWILITYNESSLSCLCDAHAGKRLRGGDYRLCRVSVLAALYHKVYVYCGSIATFYNATY